VKRAAFCGVEVSMELLVKILARLIIQVTYTGRMAGEWGCTNRPATNKACIQVLLEIPWRMPLERGSRYRNGQTVLFSLL
jgi:hypothetical protein